MRVDILCEIQKTIDIIEAQQASYNAHSPAYGDINNAYSNTLTYLKGILKLQKEIILAEDIPADWVPEDIVDYKAGYVHGLRKSLDILSS